MKVKTRIVLVFAGLIAATALLSGSCFADTASDLVQAEGLLKQGDYASALTLLKGVPLDDQEPALKALDMMHKCYAKTEGFNAAAAHYETLLSEMSLSGPVKAAVRENLWNSYKVHFSWDKCLKLSLEILVENQTDVWLERAFQSHRERGDFEHAMYTFQDLVTQYPQSEVTKKAYLETIRWMARNEKLSDALNLLQQMSANAEWQIDAAACKCEMYCDIDDYDNAIAAFNALTAAFATSEITRTAYERMTRWLCTKGKCAEALSILNKLDAERPDWRGDALLWKFAIYSKTLHQYQAAYDSLYRLATECPDHAHTIMAKIDMGVLMTWNLNNTTKAREWLNEVLNTSGVTPEITEEAKWHLAYCHYVDKDYAAARDAFAAIFASTQADNYKVSARYMTGDCMERLSDYSGASAAFNYVMTNFPNHVLAKRAAERLMALAEKNLPVMEPEAVAVASTGLGGAN